ncbi:autophagy-related protein 27 [Ganoderma leucocontextum]|nr:autophagy-related protein 27 [Ganoderma leucocontextum]
MPPFPRHPVSRAVLLTLLSALVAAQDDQKPFDCRVTIGEDKYDLTGLKGEFSTERDISLPPSTIHDKLFFNLCEDLTQKKDVPQEDQCPSGTRACLVRTSKKNGQEDRVISVVPVANSSASAVSYEAISSPKGLQLTFAGASYPSTVGSEPQPQRLHVKLLCASEPANLNFTSYDGKDLYIQWDAPAGCPFNSPPDDGTKEPSEGDDDKSGPGDKEEESVGSGLGYFFLLLFLAFVAYFALGAYYNYSTYGASGADLIPHRDFWREVPYMIRDLVSHICSAVRPRHSASRGGYIAV